MASGTSKYSAELLVSIKTNTHILLKLILWSAQRVQNVRRSTISMTTAPEQPVAKQPAATGPLRPKAVRSLPRCRV